jgi:2,4-dienoyl-CoA reductase-like NADH-dependent reductase (Old Yellow Enzyme family)
MWTPPERIKHALPAERVPTAEEAARSRLFSPITLASGLVLRERTWVPAMVPWRATEDGFVTPEVLDWYGRFADGEPGAIVVEATGIRDVPSGPLLRAGHDRFTAGLARLADVVRQRSGGRTRLLIQLIDFLRIRRRPARDRFLREHLALRPEHRERLAEELSDPAWRTAADDEVRERLLALGDEALLRVLSPREAEDLLFGARERVTDTHLSHIAELPRTLPSLFADAARRAKAAGFDGVELHYAHAYTMASFLSALNTRGDGYGGSRENRVRLPLEVHAAVRAEVGKDFTVGCRFLCDEIIEGGNRPDDAAFFGVALARAGMDFLSLSTGGKFEDAKQPKVGEAAYPYTGKSGYECMPTIHSDARGPFLRNVPKQALVRRAVREAGLSTPIVAAGGIGTFQQAESILAAEQADIVAAARQSIADPDWWKKVRLGQGAFVRRCSYTNYCEALDQKHKAVTCQLWDRAGLDTPGLSLTPDGKRRLTAPPHDFAAPRPPATSKDPAGEPKTPLAPSPAPRH